MKQENVFHYTVGELVEILKSFPKNIPILTSGYENGFENIQQPILQYLIHKPDNPYYDGQFQSEEEGDRGIFKSVILRRVVREID